MQSSAFLRGRLVPEPQVSLQLPASPLASSSCALVPSSPGRNLVGSNGHWLPGECSFTPRSFLSRSPFASRQGKRRGLAPQSLGLLAFGSIGPVCAPHTCAASLLNCCTVGCPVDGISVGQIHTEKDSLPCIIEEERGFYSPYISGVT